MLKLVACGTVLSLPAYHRYAQQRAIYYQDQKLDPSHLAQYAARQEQGRWLDTPLLNLYRGTL